jgi:cAMP-dependent protein kinase regulator
VVKEGDEGNVFYFIKEGQAVAFKENDKGESEKVLEYKENDYFGELALLKNQPRAASI